MIKYILMGKFYYPNIGGVENSLKFLSEEFNRFDNSKVVIITTNINNVSNTVLPVLETVNGIVIHRIRQDYKYRFLNEISYHFNCIRILMREGDGYNVNVLARNYFNVFHAIIAHVGKISYLVPGIVKNQNNAINLKGGMQEKFKCLAMSFIQKLAIKLSNRIYVFSENMKEQVCSLCGDDVVNKIQICKPGVDVNKFNLVDKNSKEDLRIKLGIPIGKTIVIGIARFVKAKGFIFAIEAMKNLNSDYHLVLIGNGEEKLAYEELINKKSINNVSLYEPTTKPELYYQASDIFMMSSIYEPLGQTILEAQSCGLPILYFKKSNEVITACDEVVNENFSFEMDYRDLNSMSSAIVKAKQSISEIRRSDNHEFIKKKFTWYKLARTLFDY